MYDMYPSSWLDALRQAQQVSDRPRRRARKEHPVTPAVLRLQPVPAASWPRG